MSVIDLTTVRSIVDPQTNCPGYWIHFPRDGLPTVFESFEAMKAHWQKHNANSFDERQQHAANLSETMYSDTQEYQFGAFG